MKFGNFASKTRKLGLSGASFIYPAVTKTFFNLSWCAIIDVLVKDDGVRVCKRNRGALALLGAINNLLRRGFISAVDFGAILLGKLPVLTM